MRSKILTLRRILGDVFERKQYSTKLAHCNAHMNDLPVPCKPWQPWYDDKQSFYNKHLAVGIVWWLFSFIMALYTESLYLNWGPPAQPSAPSDMVEECDDADT